MASITRLSITGLRNLAALDLTIEANTPVLITGDNGAGKTAILEGIHILASGRSFRESRLQRCQQWQTAQTTLYAEVDNQQGAQRLGWQKIKQETLLRLNGDNEKTQAELAWQLPVQVFSPESQDLLTHGPQERRRFMDWGAFYQHPPFLLAWRHYQHALRQRNHALRQQAPIAEIQIWDLPLWQAAAQVDQARHTYCQALSQVCANFGSQISDSLTDLNLHYARGWPAEQSLPELWHQQLEQDRHLGYTQTGPHRADLKLRSQERDALTLFSRGQQKLLALTLMLGQAQLLQQTTGETPVLLLDDLPAELDPAHRQRVLAVLNTLDAQRFFTTTHPNSLDLGSAQHWQLNQGRLWQ